MWEFAGYGIILGLSAGVSPGPLLAVVITQTLRHGQAEGIKVAVAPILTDFPIILAALLLFSQFPDPAPVLGVVSILGAGFLFHLGISSVRYHAKEEDFVGSEPRSYLRGALVNALSPNPYLFWFAVGTPLIIEASQQAVSAAVAFVGMFFAAIIGSKMAVALAVERSRGFLTGPVYLWSLRLLGVCLLFFALRLIWDGVKYLGLAWAVA